MSRMHKPDKTTKEVPDVHPKPDKTCPICEDTTKDLPHHIAREHGND